MIPEGFIPLIDYEQKYNDKLLIIFPSSKYRKGNIIYSERLNTFWEIVSVNEQSMYRVPELKEIDYDG